MCKYICMYVCMYAYIYTHTHTHIFELQYYNQPKHANRTDHKLYTHKTLCVYKFIYIYIYIHIYKFIYIYIYIYNANQLIKETVESWCSRKEFSNWQSLYICGNIKSQIQRKDIKKKIRTDNQGNSQRQQGQQHIFKKRAQQGLISSNPENMESKIT